jgi:hypothetical protein
MALGTEQVTFGGAHASRVLPMASRRRLVLTISAHRLVWKDCQTKFAARRCKPHAGHVCSPKSTASFQLRRRISRTTGNSPSHPVRYPNYLIIKGVKPGQTKSRLKHFPQRKEPANIKITKRTQFQKFVCLQTKGIMHQPYQTSPKTNPSCRVDSSRQSLGGGGSLGGDGLVVDFGTLLPSCSSIPLSAFRVPRSAFQHLATRSLSTSPKQVPTYANLCAGGHPPATRPVGRTKGNAPNRRSRSKIPIVARKCSHATGTSAKAILRLTHMPKAG